MDALKEIGFKCGLEIHQRLEGRKLFSTKYYNQENSSEQVNLRLQRKFISAKGELGSKDISSEFEESRQKTITYEYDENYAGMVECDDCPPTLPSEEAVEASLAICKSLNCIIVDQINFMRKTIIDGSAPSGFQRTALVGFNGFIEVNGKRIGIQSVSLEEESCSIVSEGVFSLSRLGVPLIEIATSPDIENPEEAKEVAKQIGLILRSTGKVQRGIGSIRQDVNVSISKGNRIEIKGAQELNDIPKIIFNEIRRQETLVALKQILLEKTAKLMPSIDLTNLLTNSNVKLLQGKTIFGINVKNCKKLLGIELTEDYRFASELSDYVKAYSGLKGLIHSDENLAKYGFTPEEINTIMQELNMEEEDAFIIIAGELDELNKAIKAIEYRFNETFNGVIPETRKADGLKTRFMRPLSGASRLYPETDVLPRVTSTVKIEEIKTLENIKEELLAGGLNEELASKLLNSRMLKEFNEHSQVKDKKFLATVLLDYIPAIERKTKKEIDKVKLTELIILLEENKITKKALISLLEQEDFKKLLEENNLQRFSREKITYLAAKENIKNAFDFIRLYPLNVEFDDVVFLNG
ncbi:Glutamyl-tRNA(Gln) amidotransferase subunit E [uncultured archaeon]|nr:Glutamyl-tRNA(Gln) amidotransferase subunit E [uncultured archaeon]